MNEKLLETLENLEDKIEDIKWLITTHFRLKKTADAETSIFQKSFGILGKHYPKGTVFENMMRKEWESSFIKRIS